MKKVTVRVSDPFSEGVWKSVEKNAKDVSAWPEWKKVGSGLLDGAGNAVQKDPGAVSEQVALAEDER